MCLRLYPLGDGMGKNTHLSLFFVVMKSKYDSLLQWPFTNQTPINQSGGQAGPQEKYTIIIMLSIIASQ